MTEITRVPLQPLARGTTTRIWVGVILALIVALALAFALRFHGLVVETLRPGAGPTPTKADVVLVNYTGRLTDGTQFDKADKAALSLDGMIPGFTQGLERMQRGGKYKLTIPASLGYGAEPKTNPQTGKVVIPGGSTLVFDIELLDYMNAQQLRAMQEMQMQQMQGGRGGAPGGAPGGAVPLPQPAPQPGQ
jgi:FKBP-type peptidyl-prolyl cis-trans isomerase FkpA